jgi:hypothetical protein
LAVTDFHEPSSSYKLAQAITLFASYSGSIKLSARAIVSHRGDLGLARKKTQKGLRQRDTATFKAQQQARDQADEAIRCCWRRAIGKLGGPEVFEEVCRALHDRDWSLLNAQ